MQELEQFSCPELRKHRKNLIICRLGSFSMGFTFKNHITRILFLNTCTIPLSVGLEKHFENSFDVLKVDAGLNCIKVVLLQLLKPPKCDVLVVCSLLSAFGIFSKILTSIVYIRVIPFDERHVMNVFIF